MMMRHPTPLLKLLAWHRAYLRGESPPVHDGDPHCGWYKMKRVSNGPWVPVAIWCDRDIDEFGELTSDEVLRADVYGDEGDPEEIWTYLKPITKADHEELTKYRLCNEHRIKCRTPIDLGAAPTPPRG